MNDDKIIFKTNAAGELITWETPKNEAAQTSRSLKQRIDFYIATQSLKVDDSIFIPNRETARLVIKAWDEFNVHLMVEENTYTLYNQSA
jgi:hypothetical protein